MPLTSHAEGKPANFPFISTLVGGLDSPDFVSRLVLVCLPMFGRLRVRREWSVAATDLLKRQPQCRGRRLRHPHYQVILIHLARCSDNLITVSHSDQVTCNASLVQRPDEDPGSALWTPLSEDFYDTPVPRHQAPTRGHRNDHRPSYL